MTRLQKLQLRQSTVRVDLGKLLDTPEAERTDTYGDDLGKLTKEVRSLETDVGAAIAAGETPTEEVATKDTPEGREYRQMLDKSNVGEIFDAALERRNIDGATRELQEHFHLGHNQVPLDLLGGQLETRAITPAPADVGQEQMPIVPYVFPAGAAAFLGIPQPRVAVGDAVFTVLTSTLAVGTPAEGAAQAETTGAFSADVLSPSRIQASYFYSREDSARFMGMDAALRANLSEGLQDGLDKAIVSGTNGLLTSTNLDANAVSAADTFASFVANFGYSRVDGRYAETTQSLRRCWRGDICRDGRGLSRPQRPNGPRSLMQITGGVRAA